MAKRGEHLREHILWAAKDVFLELGFERASMDVVAARAETSKRSLYAHFENKEKLFLAVIGLVRDLFLKRLKLPSDYSSEPREALVLFCGRYVEILTYEGSIQMCRVSMSETERFPEQAAQFFDVMFAQAHKRLSVYIKQAYGLTHRVSAEVSHRLLAHVLYPCFPRALFGLDSLAKTFDHDALRPDFNLAPIRNAVAAVTDSLKPLRTGSSARRAVRKA